MTSFRYIAMTADGQQTVGQVNAENRTAAIGSVEALGLYPVRVDAADGDALEATGKKSLLARKQSQTAESRLKPRHTLHALRQLANLLAAGVSLSRALRIMERESATPQAGTLWHHIHDRIADGDALADALARYPRTFPMVYVAMVRAGEAGGFLDVVLKQIAEFMGRERELKSKLASALIYPCLLAVVAAAVVTFLLWWFIPRFSEIFDEFGASLPLVTQFVQAASLAVRDYGLFVLAGLLIAAMAVRQALRRESGRRWLEHRLLQVPGIGAAATYFALVRFARTLGTLIGAGVPMIKALRVAREAVGNQTLADTLDRAIEQVQQGVPLAQSLSQCPELFDGSLIEMIAVAEQSSRLDSELVRIADEYEQELDRRLRTLVSLAEPALLFVMAAAVGTIVIGMLLPIFDLWDAIG